MQQPRDDEQYEQCSRCYPGALYQRDKAFTKEEYWLKLRQIIVRQTIMIKTLRFFLSVIVLTFAVALPQVVQAQRGLDIVASSITDTTPGRQIAVLIAVDKYKDWLPLRFPVRDAKQLKQVLQDRYWITDIIELYNENATKAGILKRLDLLTQELKPEDSVLIYYAGHGHLDSATDMGFWIPQDAGTDVYSQANWLPNAQIRALIGRMKARHVVLVSDSCFSGDILNTTRGTSGPYPVITNEYFKNAYARRSRQVLTSGASETVPDESLFTRSLIRTLEENTKPYIDPYMIFNEVRLSVGSTTPLIGSLNNTDHQDGGSFLLFLKTKEPEKDSEAKEFIPQPTAPMPVLKPVTFTNNEFPSEKIHYISPNNDGIQDIFEIPFPLTDSSLLASWQFTVSDDTTSKIVRISGESQKSLASLKKKGITLPKSLTWDGLDDKGKIVIDGLYSYTLFLWDKNGNMLKEQQVSGVIVVDTKKPQASIAPMTYPIILSPDGDGNNDSILFRNTGSVENNWKVEITNSAGAVVRASTRKQRMAPTDFLWDGTTNEGRLVPDGFYSLRLSARDEAGNTAAAMVQGIEVDKSRPVVSIAVDESIITPNGDGIRDYLNILPVIESAKGLEAWRVFVLDKYRKMVWSTSGNGSSLPQRNYLFLGLSSAGILLEDGLYRAGIELHYRNGYMAQKHTDSFTISR
jgi:flagellar hook assembly protein FlgD